jgi:hypothetical protein
MDGADSSAVTDAIIPGDSSACDLAPRTAKPFRY